LDRDTVLVTYDSTRGEPRGKFTKADKEAVLAGGSIQMECVNCTACMDACDEIMTKISKPEGLIRYASQQSVESGSRYRVTNRVKAYVGVWILLMITFATVFARRPMTDILILRQPGTLMQTTATGRKINFYVMNVVNKSTAPLPLTIECSSHPAAEVMVLGDISGIPRVSEQSVRFILAMTASDVTSGDLPVTFVVKERGAIVHTVTSRFLATGS
ncbi:MAG: 4Fe-4S dicluster domain-containing protein, partial [Candidatus Kapaibacterium sp.]